MKKGTVVFVTLFAIFKINCLGQIRDFEDILTHPIRNRNILKVGDSTRSERTFLGVIKNSNGKVVFYVAKEFYTVQTALVMHGHSRILFFNNDKKLTAAYNVNGPGELPYKLSRNSLYFKVTRDGNELIQIINVRAKLPVPLCILPDDCYWPQKK